jgi:hypothetical protein
MDDRQRYGQFPVWMVAVSVLQALSIYALGVYILAGAGRIVVGGYVALCLAFELRGLRRGCRDCYYYGRRCAFGRGLVCAWLFQRGEPDRFAARCITWRELIPDLLLSLVPLVGGIILSVLAFAWSRLIALAALVFLSSVATGYVRGSIACRHCKQMEIGCPAQKLFAGASKS